jgi:hypothetical protein
MDYKINTLYDKLPLPSYEYWHTFEDVLTQYVRHDVHKFDNDYEGFTNRKHILADRIQYIGKGSNNLNNTINSLDDVNYLEYAKDHEIVNSKEFLDWIFSLMHKDVMDKEILKMALWKVKNKIKHDKQLNPKIKSV